jgi:hypothetical protein
VSPPSTAGLAVVNGGFQFTVQQVALGEHRAAEPQGAGVLRVGLIDRALRHLDGFAAHLQVAEAVAEFSGTGRTSTLLMSPTTFGHSCTRVGASAVSRSSHPCICGPGFTPSATGATFSPSRAPTRRHTPPCAPTGPNTVATKPCLARSQMLIDAMSAPATPPVRHTSPRASQKTWPRTANSCGRKRRSRGLPNARLQCHLDPRQDAATGRAGAITPDSVRSSGSPQNGRKTR